MSNRPEDKINLADSFQQGLFRKRIVAACKRSDEGLLSMREQEFLWQMLPLVELMDAGIPGQISGKQMNYLKTIAEGN